MTLEEDGYVSVKTQHKESGGALRVEVESAGRGLFLVLDDGSFIIKGPHAYLSPKKARKLAFAILQIVDGVDYLAEADTLLTLLGEK